MKNFKSMKILHAVLNTFHQNFDDMIMTLICVSYTGRLMITIIISAFTVLRSLIWDHIVEISINDTIVVLVIYKGFWDATFFKFVGY